MQKHSTVLNDVKYLPVFQKSSYLSLFYTDKKKSEVIVPARAKRVNTVVQSKKSKMSP